MLRWEQTNLFKITGGRKKWNKMNPRLLQCRYVGEWELGGEEQQMFWHPPECGATHIIHKDANLKPLRVQLFFRAPETNTGTPTRVSPIVSAQSALFLALPDRTIKGGFLVGASLSRMASL
jgi:hypothetical protein